MCRVIGLWAAKGVCKRSGGVASRRDGTSESSVAVLKGDTDFKYSSRVEEKWLPCGEGTRTLDRTGRDTVASKKSCPTRG